MRSESQFSTAMLSDCIGLIPSVALRRGIRRIDREHPRTRALIAWTLCALNTMSSCVIDDCAACTGGFSSGEELRTQLGGAAGPTLAAHTDRSHWMN